MNLQLQNQISHKYSELYPSEPQLFSAPGRINIIGEHTDYNEGFVLPAAIDKRIYFAVGVNKEKKHRFYSFDFKQSEESTDLLVTEKTKHWAKYLIGVLAQFENLNLYFDVVFGGDIPAGAGLSSSAALESGMAVAVNEFLQANKSKFELVKIAQKAEHDYAGVLCGIMDQYVSVFGKEKQVIKLDCRSNTHEYFPLNLKEYELLLVDTKVKHSLASSEYNLRRQECERAVAYYQQNHPEVKSLRDLNIEQLEFNQPDEISYRRSKYMVEEIQRVIQATQAMEAGDLESLGTLLYQTHHGLQHLYEVSCAELDFLVDQTREMDAVLGARMMGGGFGGCTLNLIQKNAIDTFKTSIKENYEKKFFKSPEFYLVKIENGAR
jgi:galactokinase